MWANLDEQGYWKGEIWNRKKSGDLYAELTTISAIHDENGQITHYVGLFSDITQTKHIQLALERMAHHDALTGLPNRVLFADRFVQAIARCKRDEAYLAICYLDLDGFKAVNDNLGHKAGDHLLVEVAARLKSIMRQEDTIARLGGDEFGLLMCEIKELEQCELAMERIHHIVSQPYQIDGLRVVIGLSSGVTLYPLDDADADTLLRHADHAMYLAKQGGRNRYKIFDPETMA
jgi:diguanylate cyclase (GGDEF)-like protein